MSKITDIIFILDKSGSMGNLIGDTIGGYNSFVKNQAKLNGVAKLTTVLFNHEVQRLITRENIEDVPALTYSEYQTWGTTALLDAIGDTIQQMGQTYSNLADEDKPSKVIVVITTDGAENSSKEYTYKAIKNMVQHQKEKYSWEFVFLGANIDSYSVGEQFGLSPQSVSNYSANARGLSTVYTTLDKTIAETRTTGDWNFDEYKKSIQ